MSSTIASRKRRNEQIAFWLFRLLSFGVVAILFYILYFLVSNGIKAISWEFITQMPEDGMTKGGIYPAIIGTLYLVAGSMIFAFPIGVASAIYINEYTKDGVLKKIIKQTGWA